jgi:ABC-type lipoprotein release transport system permease subunit
MNPYNPVVMLAAILALGLSATLASLIPALRVSSISPLDALRIE